MTVDDQGSRGPGRRPDDDRVGGEQPGDDQAGDGRAGDGRAGQADQEYDWGGRPGEDFGPLAPPAPLPSASGHRGGAARDVAGATHGVGNETARLDSSRSGPFRTESAAASRSTARRPAVMGQSLRPDGVFTQPAPRRRRWGLILGLLGALVVLGVLAGTALFMALRPGTLGLGQATTVAAPAPTPVPAPAVASPAAQAKTGRIAGAGRAADAAHDWSAEPVAGPGPPVTHGSPGGHGGDGPPRAGHPADAAGPGDAAGRLALPDLDAGPDRVAAGGADAAAGPDAAPAQRPDAGLERASHP